MELKSSSEQLKEPTKESYLEACLQHLKNHLCKRLDEHFHQIPFQKLPFTLDDWAVPHPLQKIIHHYQLQEEEILLLLMALTPHIQAGFFEGIIREYLPHGGDFPEFGGTKTEQNRAFLPTGVTGLFLLAGTSVTNRLTQMRWLDKECVLFRHHILHLDAVQDGDPKLEGKLSMNPEFVDVICTGKVQLPALSTRFPAKHIQTELDWEDLVLPKHVLKQVMEIKIWLDHHQELVTLWDMGKKIKPGFRVMFYGPPGTGKTLTATLLGKYTKRDVFKIDLSLVVSKFIGETEKNLSSLFDKAEHKEWILFFDEADAIFGKRTGVRDAHDKYANQEISYLLQRIEDYNGLVILASNFRNNIDTAFIRRFNGIIYFPSPKPEERLILWKKAIPSQLQHNNNLDFEFLADRFELTGSQIINAVQHLCLHLLTKKNRKVSQEMIIHAVERELKKEG